MSVVIRIEPEQLFAILGKNGENWAKVGGWRGPSGPASLHDAVHRCPLRRGDAYLVEEIARRQGWGPTWHEAPETLWTDIRARVEPGIDITEKDLIKVFGPSWRAFRWVVQTIAAASKEDKQRLIIAENTRGQVFDAAHIKITKISKDAGRESVRWVLTNRLVEAGWCAGWAASVLDLVGQHGLTQQDIDTLMAPFISMFGPIPEEARHAIPGDRFRFDEVDWDVLTTSPGSMRVATVDRKRHLTLRPNDGTTSGLSTVYYDCLMTMNFQGLCAEWQDPSGYPDRIVFS